MKKSYFMVLAAICFQAKAQIIRVIDNSTREPISAARILDSKNKKVETDAKGLASISELDQTDSIVIWHPDYMAVKYKLAITNGEEQKVYLAYRSVNLSEVILSANKVEETKSDVPYTINVIKQRDVEFANQPTTAELVQNTGAVFVQKSQLGGGSPVLRGFEANKVLIVVDGIRMNNAIYRGGHLQDIISLDANMLDRAEILFGPASTIYGSDALGGVMHFYTKDAQFSSDEKLLVKSNTMIRYGSAMNEKTGHLDFNLGTKRFASITNITYSVFDDLMSGTNKLTGSPNSWDRNFYAGTYEATRVNGEKILRDTMIQNPNNNLQTGSGYDQLDIMQRFSIKQNDFLIHKLNFQYSQSSAINRYDRLTETTSNTLTINSIKTNRLRFAEWYYGPQKRLLGAYTLNYTKSTLLSDKVSFIAAYQKIDQDRISRNFQKTALTSQYEDVSVYSANLDVMKTIKGNHELRYGSEFTYNNVISTADSTNIFSNATGKAKTRYGDGGNKMSTFGLYISHSWEVNKNCVVVDGARFTANTLESRFNDTTFYKFPFTVASQKNNAVTGNVGIIWKEENDYKVSLLANTGFRTPNIDDMSKVFESAGALLIVPNANIKPEYATNMELSVSKIFERKYKLDVTGFYTLLENALVLADYKFNDQDSALFNGVKRKTQAMQNKDRAYIYGFSIGSQIDFNEHVAIKGIVNYTYGRYADLKKDTVLPLDHIPPVFGQVSLLAKQKRFDGEFLMRFNGKKSSADYSASGEDNKQYSADIVNGMMPAWFTLNVRTGYNFTKNLRLNAACENITDNRYRVFSSGINAPGRNFIVSLRYKI